MNNIKQWLSAAAALILTGVAVGVALDQSGLDVERWCKAIDRVRDVQKKEHFSVAYQPGNPIPKAAGDRVLGDCSGGVCTIAPDSAPHCSYEYEYECDPVAASGWRRCKAYAHSYVGKGWELAADDVPWMRWLGPLPEGFARCQESGTFEQCLELFDADNKAWLLGDGRICRNGGIDGRHTLAGDIETPCPYAPNMREMPMTVNRGAGSEMVDATRVWVDEDFDEL